MPPTSSFVKVIEQFWPSRGGDHVGQFALDSAFRCTQPHSSFSGRFVHRPRPSPWWSAVLGSFLSREDTSSPAVYATGQRSGRVSLDAEDDGEPTVEDPVSGN
ncbi:hypothetical protein F2Q68_00015483 [Brassica cretica]|uniref:Uncharacterized protein n=1 Tax=Brassica cretica TaxID=69181 RepID=A0A8S9H6J1_BRACR|nr:hypothetical protein F2Q68_00015483 [Brassica cretica]